MSGIIKRCCSLLAIACAFLLLYAGCTGEITAPPATQTVIRLCLRGSAEGLDRVLEKLYAQMDGENNFRLEFTFIPAAKYRDELNRILTSREDYNLVFDAPWLDLQRLSDNKAYQNLSAYFGNSEYPALEEAFPADYLNANRVNGRVDAIPITNTYWDPAGIFYRKDLLRACGLGFQEISTREQLLLFYDAVKSKMPEISPISLGSRGFFDTNLNNMALRAKQIHEIPGWALYTYPSRIVLNDNGTQVLDVVFAGDEPARFAAMEKGYSYDFISDVFLQNAAMAPYAQPESIFAGDYNTLFYTGKSASMEGALGTGGSTEMQRVLRQSVPEGEVGFWCYDDSIFESPDNVQIYADMRAWNFLCVPAYSKKTDDTMRFLNWLYADRSRLELFMYGVPEEDWLPLSDNEYIILERPSGSFSFPAYELAWSPLYHRIERTLPENEKLLQRTIYDVDSYVAVPLSGWSLNTSRISIELSQLGALYQEYYTAFAHGAYGSDTQAKLNDLHARSLPLGLETVRAEIIRQAQSFLDTR